MTLQRRDSDPILLIVEPASGVLDDFNFSVIYHAYFRYPYIERMTWACNGCFVVVCYFNVNKMFAVINVLINVINLSMT